MTDHFIDPQAFLAFAQSKSPAERYVFKDCYACALAQFGIEQHPGALILAGTIRYNIIVDGATTAHYYLPDFLIVDENLLASPSADERETYETWGALAARLQTHITEFDNAPA